MAQLLGQDGATLLKIDSGSGAARVTLYRSDGQEANRKPDGSYLLPVEVRQTGAAAADVTVWAMRNGATKTIYLRRIHGRVYFDGTGSAGNGCRYQFARFSTATPTGGTAITVIKRNNAFGASTLLDARFLDTGLTTTSVVFETPFDVQAVPASISAQGHLFDLQFSDPNDPDSNFVLAPNEGLCIRIRTVAAIVGLGIFGMISWDEKA